MAQGTVQYAYRQFGKLLYKGEALETLQERRTRLGLQIEIVKITTEVVA